MFLISQDHVLQTSIDLIKIKGFTLKKIWGRRYPTETTTNSFYLDDLELLANTPAKAESLLHILEPTAEGIDLNANAFKTEFMSFKQGTISTLRDKSLKLVDQFTYFGSNISSTESDVSIRIVKTWTVIYRFLIIGKSDVIDKMKQDFFQAVTVSKLLYGCTTWNLMKHFKKKLMVTI